MRTVFFDDFTSINATWTASIGANENHKEIFLNDSNYIIAQDGNLNLIARYTPGVLATYEKNGQIITETRNYTSGEVTTNEKFEYGSFECRCLFSSMLGSWPAFWSYGGDGIPCSQGGNNASEIDFAELMSKTSNPNIDFVIHGWLHPSSCPGSKQYPLIENNLINSNPVDFINWHTYKAVWTPYSLRFYIDGVEKWKRTRFSLFGIDIDMENLQVGNSYDEHGWFPHFFQQVKLSNQVIADLSSPPATASFDYVRIKKFFLAPEITCPTIICSTGTAILDVISEATNITWSLTPAYLFSGSTTGTGITANITALATYHGKGKITYSFNMPTGESFTAEKEVWINGPDYSEVSFDVYRSDGVPATKIGNTWLMCPNTNYQIYVMNSSQVPLSNYNWTIPSAWTRNYTYQNIISVNTNSSPGGSVAVNATNTASGCNNTMQIITGYMGSNNNCGGYFMVFTPNPSTSETTLEIVVEDEKTINENTQWQLEIYDQMQSVKEKKTKVKGKQTKINTTSWKDGVYIVRAKIGDEIISEKLVVKH